MTIKVLNLPANVLPHYREAVLHALAEIGARSGGRWTPEAEYAAILADVADQRAYALWVAVDADLLHNGTDPQTAVVGVLTLNMCRDAIGEPMVFMSRAWWKKGYGRAPFDVILKLTEQWGKERGAIRVAVMSERSSASAAADRFEPRNLWKRMRGQLAYAKWVYARGFRQRETIYEKELVRANGGTP